jgi:IclR family mhp operon transcriptional activator
MSLREEDDIQALRLGIQALRLMNGRASITCADLVEPLSLSRAAAYRVVNTLHSLGYVTREKHGRGSRYRLSPRVRRLSDGFDGDRRLLDLAKPLMLEFTEKHGWPLALATPAGDRFYVRFTTDHATSRVLKRFRAGFFRDLLGAASGYVCLAYQPEPVQSAIIRELLKGPRADAPLLRDPQRLRQLLDEVKKRGYAEYHEPGERERSIAVPVRQDGVLLGGLTLRYMIVANRRPNAFAERLGQLRELAQAIERALARG